MNTTLRHARHIMMIAAFCLVFTTAFGLAAPDKTYAAVDEQVYEPTETATNQLRGVDVPVSKNYQALIQYNISSGGTRYKGSGQCWGYADKVKSLFGGGGSRKTVKKKCTVENLYKILKNVRPGTHVRLGDSKSGSGKHSIAVYKVTKDKIYYSDANMDWNNGIQHHVESLEYIASYARYILWYVQPTGGYKTRSTKIVGYSYDLKNRIELAWKPVSGAKKYTVYRASSKNGKYTKLATVKSPLYIDKNAKSGANYYKVKPNNRGISAAKAVYNKIKPPTVHVNATKQGYAKLTWDKVKGAKKYGIYKEAYSKKKGYYYKLVKTVTGTSYTYKKKDADTQYYYIKSLASNSKANSSYLTVPVHRFAPKAKIFDIQFKEDHFEIKVGVQYDPTLFDNLEIMLYRSDKKNGEYEQINGAIVYGTDSWGYGGEYEKSKFDYKTSTVTFTDYYWDYDANYYYKAEAYVTADGAWYGWYGLDSAKVKAEAPDLSSTEEEIEFAGGVYYKYADGTVSKYIDANGNVYTKGLSEGYSGYYIYYEDDSGQKFRVDISGDIARYDPATDSYDYYWDQE